MKLQRKNTAGFTLIELLVVITIIGILATGATAVYTSQIQKARDTTRLNDVKVLVSGVEMVYQDEAEYPHSDEFAKQVMMHVPKLPKDPKHGQTCSKWVASGASAPTSVGCVYAYIVGADSNGIDYGKYEVSTAFENSGNVENKAASDAGNDPVRYEEGLEISTLDSSVLITEVSKSTTGVCTATSNPSSPSSGTDKIYIGGSPADADTASCDSGSGS